MEQAEMQRTLRLDSNVRNVAEKVGDYFRKERQKHVPLVQEEAETFVLALKARYARIATASAKWSSFKNSRLKDLTNE